MSGIFFQLRLSPPLLLAAIAAGCAGNAASALQQSGTGGNSSGGCQSIGCVPAVVSPLTFAAEVTPLPSVNPSGALGPALTEIPTVQVGGGNPVTLVTDAQAAVAATFTAASGAGVPTNANIGLDVASRIPGRPDLTFQAQASVGVSPTTGAATSTAQLVVPSALMGTTGTLSLLPITPDDQQTPPYFAQITLNTSGQLPSVLLPSDNTSVKGTLHNSVDKVPTTPFVARAFRGGTLVSSAPTISSTDGSFTMAIPSAEAGNSVTIQLTPQSQTDPWFIFSAISLAKPSVPSLSLGTVLLAPYTNVSQFNVLVQGTDETRVSGVTVSAQSTLGSSSSTNMYPGTTSFARTGVTNSVGTTVLSLIPASGNYSGTYDLVAVPPAGSQWATTCSDPKHPPQASGAGSVTTPSGPTLATLTLNPRPTLTGTVTDANGRGVANVAITATPGGAPTGNCPSTPAAPGKTTTDGQGEFTLPLDPGVYQLDYDPPAGAAAPRDTETGVQVSGTGQVSHGHRLPAGGLVSGTVVTPNQEPVPSATVKLFQPQCSGISSPPCAPGPLLIGQGVTDTNGYFQIVVPINQ